MLRSCQTLKAVFRASSASWEEYTFTDPKFRKAAQAFVENYRRQQTSARSLGHPVGMEVHDVGGLGGPTLEPGRIFTIEPEMRIEEDHTGIRLEDMLLITDT